MINNDIYINIDQNLLPIIYKTTEGIAINLNYNSSVNFSSIWLKLIDIKTNEIIKDEKITDENIQDNQIKYNFNLPLVPFQDGDKIGIINKEKDENNNILTWEWDEEKSWNINNELAEALNEIIKKEKNKNKWITEEEELNLCSINPEILEEIINNLLQKEEIKQSTYNCIDAMLNDLNFSIGDTTILIYFINKFIKNRYYKIQLKGIYNEEKYYSNYGISRMIDITDYFYEIYYDDKQDIYFLEYKTFLKDNLLNFYKYQIIDEIGQIIQDKDWTLNETKNNKIEIDSTTNTKEYVTKIFFKNINLNLNKQYKIIFYGKTNLNLEFKKEKYIQSYDLYPLIFPAKINLTSDYENGYIKINFIPYFKFNKSYEEDYFSNNNYYELYRTDELSNFENWKYITKFKINQYNINTFYFKDYFINQGIKYKYGIKSVNVHNIKSYLIESEKYITANFEDTFLIDTDFNLKIKFNPKISSFKITKNENKIETLGQQYPYIIRNGLLRYKEFSISGLISFQMDEMNQIFNKNNQKNIQFFDTDLVDENIAKERYFKNYILNWLNNNKYKVLKTPVEGNFIVQLININLTPIDSLGRMLHNFTAIAYEMEEYNSENIQKYNIYNNNLNMDNILKIESLIINDLNQTTNNEMIESPINSKIKYQKYNDNNNIKCKIKFNKNIILESFYLFSFKPESKIKILYNDNEEKIVYIGATQELMIQNAENINSIEFDFIENNVKSGITYSWIDTENFRFNKYYMTNNIDKNFQIETINIINSMNNLDFIKIKNNNIQDFKYEKTNNITNADGFFVIGNNLYDTSYTRIKPYLNPITSAKEKIVKIPKKIRIYLKNSNEQVSKTDLNSSFFINSNNEEFKQTSTILSKKLYKVPEFGSIEIENLSMLDCLWIGKNLIADISYFTYKYNRENTGDDNV